MSNARMAIVGACLLCSPCILFIVFMVLDRRDLEVWLALTVVTVFVSVASLYRNAVTAFIAIVYAFTVTVLLFVIGMAHPNLTRFLACMALDILVLAGAVLIGIASIRK